MSELTSCQNCRYPCEDDDDEKLFCLDHKFVFWLPNNKNVCEDCPMYSKENDVCVKHSEPCWKDSMYHDPDKWNEFLEKYKKRFKK